ncbi:myb family transcription factor EFM-like isoform X1 [Tasmannia lanceolata]|uniref:myb family transcription factor EFM-like isoform X1 n=1 Tax=Tasmannia lanceolata TaxID=3420 RepID=UPI004063E507
MGSSSELSLDCKPTSYSMLLKSFGDQFDQTQKLEELLARLEEERLKIDAFKRELPLCMQLLNNAMEAFRQQLETYQTNQETRPVLEEFIPIRHSSSEASEKVSNLSEKASWMTSAQLWSQGNDVNLHQMGTTSLKETEHSITVSPKLALDNKQRNGGAFLPFSKEKNGCTSSMMRTVPDLALAPIDKDIDEKKCNESEKGMGCPRREIYNKSGGGVTTTEQGKGSVTQPEAQATTTQAHRKARRCWSPDLHRRFVNALQMLGGSQVATPKQIRELMKVDGLTNDEVKSHLQKYRLHTRRPGPTPQAAPTAAPQLVVLGSIWVPPEYATAAVAHSAGPAIYGAHPSTHTSAHYCSPQDFYPVPPHHPLHSNLPHPHHQHRQHYNASPQTQSSPESDIRDAGDRSESIEEEGKCESNSWKGGDSGENGGGKGLLSLRDNGEESNGSEITLKF